MARIRTIKPEFWKHEDLSKLPEPTHMLAAALLNYCDDYGYFNANSGLIRAECSPLREPSVSIPESLRSLQTIGYIALGKALDGKVYGRVVHFDEHQRVSHPSPSKIADKSIDWDYSGENPESLRNVLETFRPERNMEQGKERNREQGTGKRADAPVDSSPDFDCEFEERFWPLYPVHEGKKPALAAFVKARRKASLENIIVGLERYRDRLTRPNAPSPKWAQGWLNDERWNDEFAGETPRPVDPSKLRGADAAHYIAETLERRLGERNLEPGGEPDSF